MEQFHQLPVRTGTTFISESLNRRPPQNRRHNKINRLIFYIVFFLIFFNFNTLQDSHLKPPKSPDCHVTWPEPNKQYSQDACHTSVFARQFPTLTDLPPHIQLCSILFRGKGHVSRLFNIIFRYKNCSFYTRFSAKTVHRTHLSGGLLLSGYKDSY
jgi:hypothetical protein